MAGGQEPRIQINQNGPYRVEGTALLWMRQVKNEAGRPIGWKRGKPLDTGESYALCRCGASKNKPFCDGSHVEGRFDGTETAERSSVEMRRRNFNGRGLVMTDIKKFCVHAGFCVSEKTDVWELVKKTEDPASRTELIRMIRSCPSGRLEYAEPPVDAPVEDELPREIGIVENGPLYARGRVVLEGADRRPYERRNRMTLCRCGASKNKPFCDGTHTDIGFRD